MAGRFAVTVHPIFSHRQLERTFAHACAALDYADLIASTFDWPIVDRTEATE